MPTIPTLRTAAETRTLLGGPTTAHTGLVPNLPAADQTVRWLRGGGSWEALPDASQTHKGVVELATNTEARAQTATDVVLTPASVGAMLAATAPLAAAAAAAVGTSRRLARAVSYTHLRAPRD